MIYFGMTLPATLRRCRLSRQLTQAQLAARCGIAQPNIAAFEGGSRRPALQSLRQLAQGLDIPMGQLLQDPPPPVTLNRFEMDALCKNLVGHRAWKHPASPQLYPDLEAFFQWKLETLYPGIRRPKSRIRSGAAKKRLNATLGPAVLQEIAHRLDKSYPEASL